MASAEIEMKAVVGSANSDKWIPQSFTGTIVEIGHVGVMFDHEYVKCLLAAGKDSIVVRLKGKIVRNIVKHKDLVGNMKLTIGNYQKQHGEVRTSERSTCELDMDDIPTVDIVTHKRDMYASEAEFHTLAGKDVNSEVTISGTVRRIFRNESDKYPRIVLEVEDSSGSIVRVTVWRDKFDLLAGIVERCGITLYDVMVTQPPKRMNLTTQIAAFLGTGVFSDATVRVQEPTDITMSLKDVVGLSDGDKVYDASVTGQVIATTLPFEVHGTMYAKCVIAEGMCGIVTLIKAPRIIQKLQQFPFAEKQKMTITTFQKKDGVLKTELHSEIALDTEDVPDVLDDTLKDLLYAPTKCIQEAEQLKAGSRVSIEGRVKGIWPDDMKTTALIEDSEGFTARVTFWRESMAVASALEKNKHYSIVDLKIGNQNFRGGAYVALDASQTTKVSELYSSDGTKVSPVKVTGVTTEQVICRLPDNKRQLFFCSDKLRDDFEEMYPKRVKITHTSDTILSFELEDEEK